MRAARKDLLETGDRMLLDDRFDDAIQFYGDASSEDPANPTILQRLGDAHRKAGHADEALAAYDRAIAVTTSPVDLAELWARKGDTLCDVEDVEGALVAFAQASALSPERFSEVDWNLRGDRYFTAYDYASAERFYQHGLEVKPNADGLRGVGLVAYYQGRHDDALAAFDAGLGLNPYHALLLNDNGIVLRELGRRDEAVAAFQRAVDADDESTDAWLNLGLTLYELGDFRAARDAYARAVDLRPENGDAWTNLGLCDLELEENEAALESFRKALAIDDSSFWAWNNMGYVLGRLGELQSAVEHLDRAIEINPAELTPWSNKVWFLIQDGRDDDAEVATERMLAEVGDTAQALNVKSQLLTDVQGRHQEALDVLKQAAAMEPGDAFIEANLAEVTLKLGRYRESRRRAQKLLARQDGVDHDTRCSLLFIVYATRVLDDSRSSTRRQAFDEFMSYYRTQFLEPHATPPPLSWNYNGLLRYVQLRAPEDPESVFLLTALMDLQRRAVDASKLSYFEAPPQTGTETVAADIAPAVD